MVVLLPDTRRFEACLVVFRIIFRSASHPAGSFSSSAGDQVVRVFVVVVIRVHGDNSCYLQDPEKEDEAGANLNLRAIVHAMVAVVERKGLLTPERASYFLIVDLVLDDSISECP